YVGPDGTAGTYFTATPAALPGILTGNRYLRYKVYLSTQDEAITPQLNDVSMDFSGNCVPPSQVLFSSLPQQTFTIDVTAANYAEATTSVTVGAGFQSIVVPLTHL